MANLFKDLADELHEVFNPDDVEMRLRGVQSELDAVTAKQDAVFAVIGRAAWQEGGEERYAEQAAELSPLLAQEAEIRVRLQAVLDEKAAAEQARKEEEERKAKEEEERLRLEAEEKARMEAEGLRPCHVCGAAVGLTMKFCPECGARQKPQKPVCKGCGADLPENAKFCGLCGTKVE